MTTSMDDDPTVVTTGERPVPVHVEAGWDELIHRVDRYVLLDRLGIGAFGVVRAAYDPELDRKVAVKLMRRGATGSQGSTVEDPAALIDEARMAARLSHPNVVAVHDVGSLQQAVARDETRGLGVLDGIYLVMEHLGGPSMLDWLGGDQTRPRTRTWREVLAVFGEAGRGLAAAHAEGMVHRDFKPQNLRFGDDGRIRVLDFGLARLVERLGGRDAAISGTPRYMAPEQHTGDALDARADQYAFCVSLWRCLYGDWPHHAEDDHRSLIEAKFKVPPSIPSGTSVPGWVGELLMRGLAVAPGDRFPDMGTLLDALADDPAVRRRRRLLGAGLAVVLVGGGYGLASLDRSSGDPCELPDDHFAGIWDDDVRARVAASFGRNDKPYVAPALREVERGLDAHLETWTARRHEVCRASVRRGERSIDDASRELECLDRQLRRVAAASSSFQQADDAVILHAAELIARLPRPVDCARPDRERPEEGTATQEQVLALEERIAEADNLARIGDLPGSLALVEEIVEEAERLGEDGSRTRALLVRSHAAAKDRRYDEAVEAALTAHEVALRVGDLESAARALVSLLSVRRVTGEYDEAELVARIARGVVAQAGPAVRVDHAFQVAALAEDREQWDLAFERLADARRLAEELYGEDHLQLGDIVIVQGIANSASLRDFDAALAHFEHAREIFRAHYGEVHPRVASIYNNIGGVYFRQGDLGRALPEFERSLEIYTQVHGADHPLTVRAMGNLGAASYQHGDVERGVELTRRALELRLATIGEDNPETINSEANFAIMLLNAGRPTEALPRAIHVYERRVEMLGPSSPQVLQAAGVAGAIADMVGDEANAARLYRALREGIGALSDEDPHAPEILSHAVSAELEVDRPEAALEHAERRRRLVRERHGKDSKDAAEAVNSVAAVLIEMERYDEAREELLAALTVLDVQPDDPPLRGIPHRLALAKIEEERGDEDTAREHFSWVLERLEPTERFVNRRARAHLGLARSIDDPSERRRHAQACIDLLEPSGFSPETLAAARALLGPSK